MLPHKLTATTQRGDVMTEAQSKAIHTVMADYDFPENFNFWKKDHEIIMELNESTLIAVHTSGVVTEHKRSV